MKHVVVYGPQACGKTLNKELLASHFGCETIIDGVSIREFKNLAVQAFGKTLFLTADFFQSDDAMMARRAEVYSFGVAMRMAGVAPYGTWSAAADVPVIPESTELAVRLRGRIDGHNEFVEVNGYYLNEYGLYFDDGCECFAEGESPEDRQHHDDHGCPHTGFYYVDPADGDEGWYRSFAAVAWCKR